MKRKKADSKIEEKIITAMIISKEFLAKVITSLDLNFFTADHFKKIAQWCVKYYRKYHEAPHHHIETLYHSWVEKGKAREETVEAVHIILEKLSDQYERETEKISNIPYLVDQAAEYFQMRNLEHFRDNLDTALIEQDNATANDVVSSFRHVNLGMGAGIDVFKDNEAWKEAFSKAAEPLFTLGPPHINSFFASILSRDNLLGMLAPEKRGKSYWCMEFAIRALMSRRKVALFEVGDMSQSQQIKRMGSRFERKPIFKKYLGRIKVPVRIKQIGNNTKVKYKTEFHKKTVSEKGSRIARQKFMRRFGISPEKTFFRLSTHASSSINVSGIFGILNTWEMEDDFVPDVIIIDYADILAEEPGTANYSARDKINETWKALRRLSQEKHCLVIAPTQADAASYDQEILTPRNFSEDKRKLAHVTGMLGLNQNPQEKKSGVMRLNWIVLREAPFSIYQCLHVGQCLELGRAYCCGYYREF